MTAEYLAALIAEAKRRTGESFSLARACFDKQRAFIESACKLKALFCTRRAAKSYTAGIYLVHEALANPNSNGLYLGLTRMSAKGILWKDVLKDINSRYSLGMAFNETELSATFPNGSIIWLTGADAHESEMEKLLGKKYKIAVVDEAASFSVDLRRLVYGILKPATIDQSGTICLMGTSGDLVQGLFFDVTKGLEPGWKLFEWTAHDNPHVAKQWQEELDDIRTNRPRFMETPLFKQWYLNQWVIDEDKLVYRYSPARNHFVHLPTPRGGGWQYVLGVDLGYDPDPSAFVVAAFHDHDPCLYLLEEYKQTQMDVTDVANRIKELSAHYPFFRVVIDGANKQAVKEIQNRHGIALTAADKIGKVDFIQIMNAELIQGKIKLGPNVNELAAEWTKLIWQMDGDRIRIPRKEHEACANHLSDAALYAWRFCYTFLSTQERPRIDLGNKDQYVKHTQKLMEESLEREIKREQDKDRYNDRMAMAEREQDPLTYYINKRRS